MFSLFSLDVAVSCCVHDHKNSSFFLFLQYTWSVTLADALTRVVTFDSLADKLLLSTRVCTRECLKERQALIAKLLTESELTLAAGKTTRTWSSSLYVLFQQAKTNTVFLLLNKKYRFQG